MESCRNFIRRLGHLQWNRLSMNSGKKTALESLPTRQSEVLKTLIDNGFLTQYQIADKSKIAISTVRQVIERLKHKGLATPTSTYYRNGVLEARNWKATTEGVRAYLSTLKPTEPIQILKRWAGSVQNIHIRTLDEIDPDGTLLLKVEAETWRPSISERHILQKGKEYSKLIQLPDWF